MTSRADWTDGRVAQLVELRHQNMTYGAIGEAMGIPRKVIESKAKQLRSKGYDLPKRCGGVRLTDQCERVDYTVRTPWGSTWEIGGDAETTDPFVESMRADGWEVSPPQAP